ncbi:MAG: outer membrane protein assembly factor BamA [Alistipes sp.]|nr:outer membrane protein assembly factor BamA [Alistipes sp.]
MIRFIKIAIMAMVLCCGIQSASAQQSSMRYTMGNEFTTELVDSVDFDINAPMLDDTTPKLYYIRKINLHGVKYLNHSILKSSAGLVEGDSVYLPSNFIPNAMQRLWAPRYFSNIQIGASIEGDSLDLEIFLKERARILTWNFEGITKSKREDLRDVLKLKRNSELSDYVIDKNIKLIKEHYSEKGFRTCNVDVRIDNDSVYEQCVNVTFIIDKGPKVRVGEINIIGNEKFTDKRLRRTFKKTHQKSILFFLNRKLLEEDYEEDKLKMLDFYNSQGFRNAHIVRDSVYFIDDRNLGIDIEVEEGNRFYVRDVKWVGNSVYETSRLESMLGLQPGDVYDKKSLHKRLGIGREMNPEEISISNLYKNNGYLMSQIEPAEMVVGPDSLDLEIRIFEGKPFTVNNVGITGNVRLDDEVIRRELFVRPGELYNQSLLMQTLRTLMGMGHFDEQALAPDVQPVSDELVDVNFPLVEKASDQFNIAGGWGSGTFVGSVGITLNNLSLRNFFKKGAWRPYPSGQNQKLSISGQTNGTYYKALSLSFTDPWFGGRRPNSLSVSAYISEQNNAYYVWQSATMYYRSIGAAIGFGKRLQWPDPYFTFYGELGYQRYSLKGWNSFIISDGVANTLSLKLVLQRSSTDSPFYARSGSEFTLSVQATPPFSLWDGKDYAALKKLGTKQSQQEMYRWIEYHKWLLKARWYFPLTTNQNLVLMLGAEMGYLGHYNKHKVSPFERFEVGGDGMTGYNIYGVDIIALRGYEDGALDPSSYYSVGYNKYTMELRYPIIMKPSSSIYVLGFLEGGNGFNSWKEFSPFKIKRSAGLGVRLYLPIVGMIGVDWGWGFDPAYGKTKRSGSQFHFVLGQQF